MSAPAISDQIRVELGARSYDILIGSGLIDRAGALIAERLGRPPLVVVADETVAALHLPVLARGLEAAGFAPPPVLTVPPGEGSKDWAVLGGLLDRLLKLGIERRTTIVALGGGVVGDLAGFTAAVALRGLDFIQVPTTLLAQVDSSVGGKTGVNMPTGKNLVGAFHQPRLVLADTGVLATLPRREMLAGYAEIVKYGLIDRPDFFAWLEANGADLVAGDPERLASAIAESCRAKAAIVGADEREAGARALLNLGHTFGHALEAECRYDGRLLHGEAVAAGMSQAFALSAALGLAPAADAERLDAHLRAVGLPAGLGDLMWQGWTWRPDALIAHMARDKKVRDGRIVFVLARGIGQAFVAPDIAIEDVRRLLEREAR